LGKKEKKKHAEAEVPEGIRREEPRKVPGLTSTPSPREVMMRPSTAKATTAPKQRSASTCIVMTGYEEVVGVVFESSFVVGKSVVVGVVVVVDGESGGERLKGGSGKEQTVPAGEAETPQRMGRARFVLSRPKKKKKEKKGSLTSK
jgi:hypothetical protein